MRDIILFVLLFLTSLSIRGQEIASCETIYSAVPLSKRTANYVMDVSLDEMNHSVTGNSSIEWINYSPDTVSVVRLYMYLNAFKNSASSFIKGSGMNVMGQNLNSRRPEDWGWIEVREAVQKGEGNLSTDFVHPTDDNKDDETVLELGLKRGILPGDTLYLNLQFESKLPRTIARSGYGEHDFNHFVHWYPKLGVYEQDIHGNWGWNCHQFLRQMEFYGDHGNYHVTIETPESFELGGSGCFDRYKEPIPSKKGRVETVMIAEDVIDFGWVTSPNLEVTEDHWNHVDIRLLYPKSHASLVPRLLTAAKNGLAYLDRHVGEYPYRTLTILDPPIHGLRSGFMEYPTYITGGAFHSFPKSVRSMESLIIHEFSHQYFMQMMANNEKEEPWLDEGFVTFYEDCIMEDAYGDASLIDLFGYRVRNSALTRNEYTSLSNPRVSPIAIPGWKVNDDYKGIIYSKTATMLQTLRRYLGEDHFDEMMRTYFERHKFTHPRKKDFVNIVKEEFENHPNILSPMINDFLVEVLDKTSVCDFAVTNLVSHKKESFTGWKSEKDTKKFVEAEGSDIYVNSVRFERKGELVLPVEIRYTWEDGSQTWDTWDGIESIEVITQENERRLIAVEIDPLRKLFLDLDFNNNSYTTQPDRGGIWKYALRSIYWVQNAMQATSFLM